MQVTCKRCGTGITLPAETQTGDVIRCGQCGKKLRITLRPSRHPVQVPVEAVSPPPPRRRRWVLRLAALAVMGGAGFAVWQNGPPDLAALKTTVERQIAESGLIPTSDIVGDSDPVETHQLAARVASLFETRCHRCHGAGGSDEGGFNFVLRLDKLVADNAYVTAGDPADSYLFSRIEGGEMPPPDADNSLSPEEIALVREWIEAGAPGVGNQEIAFGLVSSDKLLRVMREDLQLLDEAVRPNTRYFTLAHLYNAGLSQDELETYRLAMAKLLNSLSWEAKLVTPVRVGDEETLLRINLSDLGWSTKTWDAIVDTDPYAVTVSSDDGQAIRQLTGTNVPNVRADWFVSRASRAPLYYDILEIPQTLNELAKRAEINIDIAQNIAADKVVRAAFIESGVSDHNRMIERHKIPAGGLWVSYDFASSVGQQNVLEHPLGPDGDDAFKHDGGEIIFNLPNGLQGYLLVNGAGKRIDKGPLTIVADDKQPDRAVVAGLSCMSCHANGMIRKQDEVRPTVLANRDAFPSADRILRQYPEPQILEGVLTEDTTRFESALQDIGFARLTDTSEPIFHMAKRFDQAVDSSLAAAEFGLTKDKFFEQLDNSPEIAKVLGVLKTPNGKVKRQQFLAEFKAASQAFGLGIGLNEAASPGAAPIASNPSPDPQDVPQNGTQTTQPGPNVASAGTTSATPTGTTTPPLQSTPQTPGTNPTQVPIDGAAPGTVPTEGAPVTDPVKLLSPEDFLHDWTKANGDPLVFAHFREVTPKGDVRVTLVPRQWRLNRDDDYSAFSGTFWVFYQKPGTPLLVRIGDVSLPSAPLNYVDYAKTDFCEEDQAYLSHLEQLADYAYVKNGRVRYFTFPWELVSVDDQQYVYKLIEYLKPVQSPEPLAQQPLGPPEGTTPPTGPPPLGPPPNAIPPQEAPAGPPDLPGNEAVESAVPPGADAPPPRQPSGY